MYLSLGCAQSLYDLDVRAGWWQMRTEMKGLESGMKKVELDESVGVVPG